MSDFNDFVNADGVATLRKSIESIVQSKHRLPKKSKIIYGTIPITFWTNPEYKEFQNCSNLAKLTYLYLIACPRRNMIGIFRQPIASMAVDLHTENAEVEAVLRELAERDLVQVDTDTHYVWVVDLFQTDVMISRNGEFKSGDKVLTGAIDMFHSIPDIPLKKSFHKKYASLLKLENSE
jgi:hypothetical protein